MIHATTKRAVAVCAVAGLILVAAGCGSSSSSSSKAGSTTAAAVPTTTTTTAAAPVAHLGILTPRRGAHTGATIVVRVRLTGAVAGRAPGFRYAVDHGRSRSGTSHFTLRGLTPGRHRLLVTLAGNSAVRASTVFTVTPPVTTSVQTIQSSTQTTTSQSFTAPAPATSAAPPPPPPTSTATTTSAPTSTHTPSGGGGGVPQGGGGDGDADNSGGPSDGDGSV